MNEKASQRLKSLHKSTTTMGGPSKFNLANFNSNVSDPNATSYNPAL
jgi:hypothetical protein